MLQTCHRKFGAPGRIDGVFITRDCISRRVTGCYGKKSCSSRRRLVNRYRRWQVGERWFLVNTNIDMFDKSISIK